MSDSEESIHNLPKGVMGKRRRGWEGESMEMSHQMESGDKAKNSAGVDISQFRNFEVGKGYQAKHVIRQRTGESSQPAMEIKDMTGSKEAVEEKEAKISVETLEDIRKSYIKSSGLREFRKEIEKILNS
jgi:hypothetical protein